MRTEKLDAVLRRVVPAVPPFSRHRLLMMPLDLIDRIISAPFGLGRRLPPNRMRLRVGVGNRILFNQFLHESMPVSFWLAAFASNLVGVESRILDVGSGCGRYAATLRDFVFYDMSFRGHYTGVDVDREMVEWCRRSFPADRFTFLLSGAHSETYNPGGVTGFERIDVDDDSQDFAFSNSLLTHLLEDDVVRCLREVHRLLAPGAAMQMTVFCLDHLEEHLGGRWTFRHELGLARIESETYPEAAVAYTRSDLERWCRDIGFADVAIRPGGQSLLTARKPVGEKSR